MRSSPGIKILAGGQQVIDIFDQLGSTLLILGAPGAGKTFALLELARDLLNRAEQNLNQPIPVVFNLSSWQNPGQGLADWMTDELSLKYHIPRKIGRRWIAEDKILPLLEGLDEVRPNIQALCVQAINAFREGHRLAGVAVCSRTEAYEKLKNEHMILLFGWLGAGTVTGLITGLRFAWRDQKSRSKTQPSSDHWRSLPTSLPLTWVLPWLLPSLAD